MPRAKRGQAGYLDLKRRLRSDMTGPEKRLWSRLRVRQFHGLKFRRQHGIGPYIVDFYCPEQSLVIELDGESHAETAHIQKDQVRDRYLRSIGLKVLRYRNDDVVNNLEGVLEDLQRRVSPGPTSPSPSALYPSRPPLTKGRWNLEKSQLEIVELFDGEPCSANQFSKQTGIEFRMLGD